MAKTKKLNGLYEFFTDDPLYDRQIDFFKNMVFDKKSTKGFSQLYIDKRKHRIKGNVGFDKMTSAGELKIRDVDKIKTEVLDRNLNKTYFDDSPEALKLRDTVVNDALDEAYMLDLKAYWEHQSRLKNTKLGRLPEDIGSDDLGNMLFRMDDTTKGAKDGFEALSESIGNPWEAFINRKTDELTIINEKEWLDKGKGKFVDIFTDGITLSPDEVKQLGQVVKTGKLGLFPAVKARYLLKEILEESNAAAKAGNVAKTLKTGGKLALIASILGAGPIGSTFAAVDATQRTKKFRATRNPLDGIQAFLSGLSAATGATGIGEIISTPTDFINLTIDAARYERTGPIKGSRARFN